MKNLGVYSEVVEIATDKTTDEKAVIFRKSGEQGKGEVIWEAKHLATFQFDQDLLEAELKEINEEKSKLMLEKILKEEKALQHILFFF